MPFSQTWISPADEANVTDTLFKAAMFGRDANWGRILCAIGYSDADLDINKVSVTLASSAEIFMFVRRAWVSSLMKTKH